MEWHYSGHNEYTSGKVKDFNYKKTTEWKPLHSLVLLTATCYLSKGKKSEHDDKSLNPKSVIRKSFMSFSNDRH